MIKRRSVLFLLVSLSGLFFFIDANVTLYARTKDNSQIKITSVAFNHGEMIPAVFTCDGKDISPPLAWEGVPKSAKSLAIIGDDPDAPMGTWVHWVLFNIPPTLNELPRDIPPKEVMENKSRHGINDFRRYGYGGPCPPGGTHRYFFKIYALDRQLTLKQRVTKDDLLKAMRGHILAEGQLMGRYRR